jgi:hypothetical protein
MRLKAAKHGVIACILLGHRFQRLRTRCAIRGYAAEAPACQNFSDCT